MPSATSESWNLESLQGVVDAAEQTSSPMISGFQRCLPVRSARSARNGLRSTRPSVEAAAGVVIRFPCALIFNECPRDDWVVEAIGAGFNLVMLADPDAPLANYFARVAAITRMAYARGVAVEAELGELPCGSAGGDGPLRGGKLH